MTNKHPHYEFLTAIANGGALSDWECMYDQHRYWTRVDSLIHTLVKYPENCEVRRKLKKIKIGDMWVTPPMCTAPLDGSIYWIANPLANRIISETWLNDELDKRWLASRMCHDTEQGAIEHSRALILVSGGTP